MTTQSETPRVEDARLEYMSFTPEDGLRMAMSHPLFFNLISDIVGLFKDKGAVNVLEFSATPKDDTIGELTVTIQRKEGKTFGQLNAELQRDLTTAHQRISFLESAEIGQVEQDNKALKQQLAEFVRTEPLKVAELVKLRKQLAEADERLGQKLAACGCAALMDTPETHEQARIEKDNPFWSPAYEDVMRRTAECISLRESLTVKSAEVERLQGFLREAAQYLRGGKLKFAPNTTNSDVDLFLNNYSKWEGGK